MFLKAKVRPSFSTCHHLVVLLEGSTGPQSTQGPHPYHNNFFTNSTTVCQIYVYVIYWNLRTKPNQRKNEPRKNENLVKGASVMWESVLRGTDQTHSPTPSLSSTDFVCCLFFVFLRKIKKCKS